MIGWRRFAGIASHHLGRFFWALSAILWLGSNGLADSDLLFPRLSFGSDEFTGLAVVNPNAESAIVTFTAFGEDGQPLHGAGIQNPVEVTVGAGRQFAQVTVDLFGSGAAEGAAWIRATSPSNDLAGFFLYLKGDLSVFDGADLPLPSVELIFNVVRLDEGFSTELNLVNPGSTVAQASLTLSGPSGPLVRELSIPAQGVRRLDVASLFGVGPLFAAGSAAAAAGRVTVSSDSPLAGFEFVRGPRDLLGVNARPADELLETLLFPQLAVLGGVSSEVSVANYASETVLVTLRAHKPDGSLYGVGDVLNNPVTRSLGPGESLREDLAGLFGFHGADSLEGWLEVVSSSKAINATLSYSVPAIQSLAAVAGSREPSRQALFSHIATDIGFFTGVALLNGSELTANVRVVALRPDGSKLGTYDTVLLPGQRISRLVEELISPAAGQAGGFIWVSSDVPIFLTSLFGNASTGVLANIPPQPVPDSFRPDSDDPRLSLEPLLAILSPAASQNFSVDGATASTWSVNNLEGGAAAVGTVSNSGLYTAPAVVPEDLPVTIAASTGNSVVGGSIDILSPELFLGTPGTPQSVAYLESSQRVYFSELAIGATAGAGHAAVPVGTSSARVVEVIDGAGETLLDLPAEEIPKLIPYAARNGQEYLLLAAKISGRVLRLDPRNRQVAEVAAGLDQPTALVYDPVEEELLVAVEGGVSAIAASQVEVGLAPAGSSSSSRRVVADPTATPRFGAATREDFLAAPRGRLTVNQCNGNVYLSLEQEGKILEYVRLTGALRVLADGLQHPGNLLGLYRKGVGCPEAFHLFVPEPEANRITLIVPELALVRPWLNLNGISDLALIPPGGPLAPGGAILLAGGSEGQGEISLVRFPGLYRGSGFNPPRHTERSGCVLSQVTRTSGADVESARVAGGRVVFVSSDDLTGENPDGSQELFSIDGDGVILQRTDAPRGSMRDLVVSADGARVAFASDAVLTNPDPPGENLFLLDLEDGEITAVQLRPEGSPAIDGTGRFVAVAAKNDPFGNNEDHNSEIFLIDTAASAGEKLQQITATRGLGNRSPSLSDEGSLLAFRSTANFTGENPSGDLYVFTYQRSGATFAQIAPVERSPGELAEGLNLVSGDGTRLAFVSQENLTGQNPTQARALFVADLASGGLSQRFLANRAMILTDISRDGAVAAVSTTANPNDMNRDRNAEVFLVGLDKEGALQLTRSREAINFQADLSPDGLSVTVLSDADYLGLNADRNVEAFLFRCQPR